MVSRAIFPRPIFPDVTRDEVFWLETRRLWLRWPRPSDGPAIACSVHACDWAGQSVLMPSSPTSEAAETFIVETRDSNAAGHGFQVVLALKAHPEACIGMAGIAAGHADTPMLDYWLDQAWWGKGLMTEAVQALTDTLFAFTHEGALDAALYPDTPASRQVLENCGFSREREMSAETSEPAHFRIDRKAWTALKPGRSYAQVHPQYAA